MTTCARAIAFVLIALALAASRAFGHPPVPTFAIVDVVAGDPAGRIHIIVTHDALAYALNDTSARVTDQQMHQLLKGPVEDLAFAVQDGRERFAGSLRITVDGVPISFVVTEAPSVESINQWKVDHPTLWLPCTMDFLIDADLPRGAGELTVRFPPVLSDVMLSVERPGCEMVFIPLLPGEVSPPFDIRMAGASVVPPAHSTDSVEPAVEPQGNPVSIVGLAWRYVRLGFTHIIPHGQDHALFVLGLFLLTPRVRPLLMQITMFTIAHTVTLTLATLGVVRISPAVVEPVIALTIMVVAVENLASKDVHPWRGGVAFVFGLVHGLGFATVLMEVGLPVGELAAGLVAFSIGIECGHITVLAIAFATIGWWRDKPWYRVRVAIPLSVLIAMIAGWWAVERIF